MGVPKYILEGKEVKKINSLIEWGKFMEKDTRILKQTLKNGLFISTVFLGLDYGFGMSDVPIVFETMVFKGKEIFYEENDYEVHRYSSYDDAIKGHKEMVKKYAKTKTTKT